MDKKAGKVISSLDRENRTGRKGTLGKPSAAQRANNSVNKSHMSYGYRARSTYRAGRPAGGVATLFTGMFARKGRSPRLITIMLVIAALYFLFSRLGGNIGGLLESLDPSLQEEQTTTQVSGETYSVREPYDADADIADKINLIYKREAKNGL